MFITEQDYKTVVGQHALSVLSQADPGIRANAELAAIEEISGYLRNKYDCKAIFEAKGPARNRKIIQITCDVSLYHLTSSVPAKMGFEIRKERYDMAIKWLESVQRGLVSPNLPLAVDDKGEAGGAPVIYGTSKKHNHEW